MSVPQGSAGMYSKFDFDNENIRECIFEIDFCFLRMLSKSKSSKQQFMDIMF